MLKGSSSDITHSGFMTL